MRAAHAKYGTAILFVICCLVAPVLGQERTRPHQSNSSLGGGDGAAAPRAQERELAHPKYLRKGDASLQIGKALQEAARTGRNVLLVVGGEWCPWCETLHRFLKQQPELVQISEHNFVTVHLYYGSDDKNEKALAPYPKVLSVPHFFVVSPRGMLLDAKAMEELEEATKPSVAKFREFLTKSRPAAASEVTGN